MNHSAFLFCDCTQTQKERLLCKPMHTIKMMKPCQIYQKGDTKFTDKLYEMSMK
jgi:hypothetical protein